MTNGIATTPTWTYVYNGIGHRVCTVVVTNEAGRSIYCLESAFDDDVWDFLTTVVGGDPRSIVEADTEICALAAASLLR